MRLITIVFISIFTALPLIAWADEQLTPLAESGDWIALAHRPSMTDPPDICAAANLADHLFFRSDDDDIEIRYVNHNWSLPANVSGKITLSLLGHNYPLDITDNTNDTITATISKDQLQSIVSDMNKASSLTLVAGSSEPIEISLIGSNKVITAFLTCAGIDQPGNTGGDNPFK